MNGDWVDPIDRHALDVVNPATDNLWSRSRLERPPAPIALSPQPLQGFSLRL